MLITKETKRNTNNTSFIQAFNYLPEINNVSFYYKFSILNIFLEDTFLKLS